MARALRAWDVERGLLCEEVEVLAGEGDFAFQFFFGRHHEFVLGRENADVCAVAEGISDD